MTDFKDICDRALQLAATQDKVAVLNDGTTAGDVLGVIYAATVATVLREVDPAFARRTAVPLITAGTAAPLPWQFEFLYPSDCVRLRQVRPGAGGQDPEAPLPVRASVAFDIIGGVNTKVILTNQIGALATYTCNSTDENQWDSAFAEAVIRRLANFLSLAMAGRPDLAREMLDEAQQYSQLAESIDEV